MFEKIFPHDELTKRERVERTLGHLPVDRVALHDQVSYNPGVISLYTGKEIQGFAYTIQDIGAVIRKTLDACFPPTAPVGTDRIVDTDGFVYQQDHWTSWHISRPFADVEGAKKWLDKKIAEQTAHKKSFNDDQERNRYRAYMLNLQQIVGDTVIIDFSIGTGFCTVFDKMGLELYTFFSLDYPVTLTDFMEISTENAVRKVHAAADRGLSPVVLIAEDFSTKQGPIFSPEFLHKFHFPYVKRLTEAWKSHGIHVIYHSDGNYKKVIPDLISCGVDGFYCLEPNCGMDIVELKNAWPQMVWAGGLDGVALMEQGTPDQVRAEVRRHIQATDALQKGGMFLGTSSEINPPIKPENYQAMIAEAGKHYTAF